MEISSKDRKQRESKGDKETEQTAIKVEVIVEAIYKMNRTQFDERGKPKAEELEKALEERVDEKLRDSYWERFKEYTGISKIWE